MANVIEFSIRGVDDFTKAGKSATTSIKSIATATLKWTAAATASVAVVTTWVKSVANAEDAVGKFASRIGVTTEALSALQFAGEMSGIGISQMNMSVQRLTRRVEEAAIGTGEAKQALIELGISAQNFVNLTLEEKMIQLADAFANTADKTRLAFKLFDSEGVAMLQLLGQGSEAMRALAEDARFLGVVVSETAAVNAAEMNNQFTRLSKSVSGVSRAVADMFIPFFTKAAQVLADFIARNRESIVGFFQLLGDIARAAIVAFNVAFQFFKRFADFFSSSTKVLDSQVLGFLTRLVDNFRRSFLWVFDTAVEIFPKIGEVIFTSFQIAWEAVVEAGKWAWENIKAIFTDAEVVGADALVENIIEATSKLRGELDATMRDFGSLVLERGTEAGEALTSTFGFSLDEAKNSADELINSMMMLGETSTTTTETMVENSLTFTEVLRDQASAFLQQQGDLTQEMAKGLFDSLMFGADRLSKTFAETIVMGKNLMEGLRNFLRQTTAFIIETLINIGLQRLLASTIFKAASVSEASSQIAGSLAQVYSNSFASAAAIPLIGWQIAPGVAAANLAVATAGTAGAGASGAALGASVTGIAHGGLPYVPREGTYLLDRGERVLSADENEEFTAGIRGAGDVTIENINIEVLPNATNAEAMLDLDQRDWDEIVAGPVIRALDNLSTQGINTRV